MITYLLSLIRINRNTLQIDRSKINAKERFMDICQKFCNMVTRPNALAFLVSLLKCFPKNIIRHISQKYTAVDMRHKVHLYNFQKMNLSKQNLTYLQYLIAVQYQISVIG